MGPNLLADPSFATYGTASSAWGSGNSCWSLDSALDPNGQPVMDLTFPCSAGQYQNLTNSVLLPPGEYDAGAMIETSGFTGGDADAYLGQWPNGWTESTKVGGTSAWTKSTITSFIVPSGSQAHFSLQNYGAVSSGVASFAEPYVKEHMPPPLRMFVEYPNWRGVMFDDGSLVIRTWVTLQTAQAVTLKLVDSSGNTVAQTSVTPTATAFEMDLDASGVSDGSYQLVASTSGFSQTPYDIEILPASIRSTLNAYIDPQNIAHWGGSAHFPLGIYDTTGYSSLQSYWDTDLSAIAQAPINMIINYWLTDAPIADIESYTTAMAQYGMVFLPTVNDFYTDDPNYPSALATDLGATNQDQLISDYTADLASDPGIVGYYTQDEPALGLQPETFHQYKLIEANDPSGFTFAVLGQPSAFSYWRDTLDVFGTDPYPLQGRLGSDEAKVADQTAQLVAAVRGSRPVWTVIQFYQANSTAAWPTEQQLHDMSWMAIDSGAQGLFYWSYGAGALAYVKDWSWAASTAYNQYALIRDPNGNVERASVAGTSGATEPVWPTGLGATTTDGTVTWKVVGLNESIHDFLYGELVGVTKGIKALEPVLLSGDTPVLSGNSQAGTIFTKQKDVGGVRYVFAYNHSAATASATFTLASGASSVTALDEDASGDYSLGATRAVSMGSTTQFTDSFAPYQAHVYEVQ